MKYFAHAFGASIIAVAFESMASAQTASADALDNASEQSGYELEEIVVTAQRRRESAQDVPISIAAFSNSEMERLRLESSADLGTIVPGLSVNPLGARSPIFLRGVGNNGASTAPSVLAFIDGVYQPFDATGSDFNSIQSIEVAKGPQGTLFGRNATGGIIQVTTRNPLDWQGAEIEAGYANYDTPSGRLYAAAKIAEKVAADISGFYYSQRDGWGTNLLTGDDMYTQERYGARSKWVAEIGDNFTATLSGDYTYRFGQVGTGISLTESVGFLYNPLTDSAYTLPTIYDVVGDKRGFYRTKEGGGALTLDGRLGEVRFLSISSYRHAIEDTLFDGDLNDVSSHTPRDAFTQELQLSGRKDSFSWIAGLYYFGLKDEINTDFVGIGVQSLGVPPGERYRIFATDKTDAYAAYAQTTFEVLPATNLTLGARYTVEERDLSGFTTGSAFLSPGSAGHQQATFKKPNYRVAVDHEFAPDMMGYASWNRAFNAGFFNNIAVAGYNDQANPRVDPEIIDAYEIGIKSDLLDHHLRVKVSAFQYDYGNLQQQVVAGSVFLTLNAAAARIRGVDLDISARPSRDLMVSLSVNYLDSEFRSYPTAPEYAFGPTGALLAVGSKDAAGNRLVQAPKLGLQATATHSLQTDIGTFETTASVNYKGKAYVDPQNQFVFPERTLVGLSEKWTSRNGATSITAWAKNLTDNQYNVAAALLTPVGVIGSPGAPRTYGLTIGQKF